jgi:YHS domain-containing protein
MKSCPVCGQPVDDEAVRGGSSRTAGGMAVVDPQRGTRQLHDGRWYYLCSVECRSAFMATPEKYVPDAS